MMLNSLAICTAFVLGFLTGCVPQLALPIPAPDPARVPVPEAVPAEVHELVDRVDAHRRAAGCRPLAWHAEAARVAQAHSMDMRDRHYFDHVSPEGRSFADRVQAAGIAWRAVAENIALTQGGAEHVLGLWLNSPMHRRNIEDCVYTHHGVGLVGGYWTHLFITPAGRANR